jgi:hypothetical protein
MGGPSPVVMAGVASLLLARGSGAAYTGITFEQDLFGLDGVTPLAALGMPASFRVYNIYATTSQPDDQIIGVIGSPEFPFSVFVQGQQTAFFNVPVGPDHPVHTRELLMNPALNWDSFMTIGAKVQEEFGQTPQGNPISLQVPPGTPGPPDSGKWGGGVVGMNMAWVLPPVVGDPPTPPPSSIAGPDLRVLIMRLTVQEPGKVIEGSFGILSVTGGVLQEPLPGSFKALPAPGALAVLAALALPSLRRRR